MVIENNRVADRRISDYDFRKEKTNRREGYRRRIDRVNHSIYYVILFLLAGIMLSWLMVDLFFLMGEK